MRDDFTGSDEQIWSVATVPRVGQASYARNRPEFVERFGPGLPEGMLDRLDAIQARLPELCAHLGAEPWTLLHGDYRLDNMLFRPNGDTVVLGFPTYSFDDLVRDGDLAKEVLAHRIVGGADVLAPPSPATAPRCST